MLSITVRILLLLIAPVVQIVLLLRRKHTTSIFIITIKALALGLILCFADGVITSEYYAMQHIKCSTDLVAMVIIECLLLLIIIPIIGSMAFFISISKKKG
jgi:hypothetical protein